MSGDESPSGSERRAEYERGLIAAWAQGDAGAGKELAALYFRPIRTYFHRRAPQDYEDLVQKTFLELARVRGRFRGESTVRVYIYGIARNVLLHYIRTKHRKPDFDPVQTSLRAAYGRRPSSILIEQEHHRILVDALQELPSADQDLLELHHWEETPGPELAALFGVPVGTVYSRISRAHERLQEKFSEISGRQRTPSTKDVETWLGELIDRMR